MSERLSAEQVVRAAESLDHAYDLPAESVQALAREVQEYRAMRCDGCAKWEPCGAQGLQGLGICGGWGMGGQVPVGHPSSPSEQVEQGGMEPGSGMPWYHHVSLGTLADWFCKGFTPKDGAA